MYSVSGKFVAILLFLWIKIAQLPFGDLISFCSFHRYDTRPLRSMSLAVLYVPNCTLVLIIIKVLWILILRFLTIHSQHKGQVTRDVYVFFFRYEPEQTFVPTVQLSIISDMMIPIQRHCNVCRVCHTYIERIIKFCDIRRTWFSLFWKECIQWQTKYTFRAIFHIKTHKNVSTIYIIPTHWHGTDS